VKDQSSIGIASYVSSFPLLTCTFSRQLNGLNMKRGKWFGSMDQAI
jgi:hypothetical protein